MKKRGARTSEADSGGEQGFWPSYADMMSAVALILFFLMLLSYIQNMITGNSLRGTEAELNDTMQRLSATTQEVAAAQEELQRIFADLELARQDLHTQQSHIDAQNAYIRDQEQTLSEQRAALEEQGQTMAQQERTMQEQKAALAEQERTMAEQRTTLAEQERTMAEQRTTLAQQEQALSEQKATLDRQGQAMAEQKATLEQQSQAMAEQKATLEQQTQAMAQQELTMEEQRATLEQQAQFILSQQEDIKAQRELIARQQAQAEQQKYYLTVTQQELEEVRRQMQEVSVLRWEVIDQIRRNVGEVMGNPDTVTVNENGNLVLGESVLFATGSYDLNSANYRKVLDQLAKGFLAFLSDPENTKHVDSIVIAGHADVTGSEYNNRELSAKRALSVLNYLLSANGGTLGKPEYARFFSAAGYGSTRPAVDENTFAAYAQNRRIEISIVLKDDSVLDILNNYLEIPIPETVG